MFWTNLLAARTQMGVSFVFHIIFSVLGVGLPVLLCISEGLALFRKDAHMMMLARQWTRAFAILFAIGAVWEANNVWLTYLIVGLLTAFPFVAQTLTTAFFIPLMLILIGIVLRGASFVFRSFKYNHITFAE